MQEEARKLYTIGSETTDTYKLDNQVVQLHENNF